MKQFLAITLMTILTSNASFALQEVAKVSASTLSEEVEMEMTTEKNIIIQSAQPDAALYILSGGDDQFLTPILLKAMEALQNEETNKAVTDLELATEILNHK